MQCCSGLKGEITNSNWHLKWFPDEREEDNQNIFWCELPTGTELTLTPGWQNGELMRGNWSCNGVTDNYNSSYNQCFLLLCNLQHCFVKIILFCLWCWELEPKMPLLWVNDVRLHSLDFAETNYISDSSHPYLSTGQLGRNSYDNWKLRSDFNLSRWKNASSPQAWRCQAWIEWTFFRDTLIL